jgi:hypothetical protein
MAYTTTTPALWCSVSMARPLLKEEKTKYEACSGPPSGPQVTLGV